MTELASEFSGASVISASSNDIKFPASNVISSGNTSSGFWLTTGSFPQELVIQLGEISTIKGVEITSTGIRHIEVSKSDGPQANTWETFGQTECSDDSDVQKISLQAPPRLSTFFLRIRVRTTFCNLLLI